MLGAIRVADAANQTHVACLKMTVSAFERLEEVTIWNRCQIQFLILHNQDNIMVSPGLTRGVQVASLSADSAHVKQLKSYGTKSTRSADRAAPLLETRT